MTKPDTGGRAIPTKLAAAKSIADNDYIFAAPEGHFARVTFSTRYSAQECKKLAAFIAAAPDLVKALEEIAALDAPRTDLIGAVKRVRHIAKCALSATAKGPK